MPPATPCTFAHGDLTNVNIIVKDGHLAATLDWENSCFFLVWYECARTSIAIGGKSVELERVFEKVHEGLCTGPRLQTRLLCALELSQARPARDTVCGSFI